MAEPIIEVNNLRVIYNQGKSNEVRSLEDVSVKIYPQEYVIIFGPSGCGKSTLLYAISGLQAPTYGEVRVSGKDLAKMKKKEMVEFHQVGMGMIFQAFYLISSLTILDNVCLPKTFRGENIKQRRELGFQLLRRFGIAEQAGKFPNQLSGGQKQRVAIARSLVNNPSLILADEPVGNLDSESAQNVLDILKELNEVDKKTVIMVTHNPEHLRYADRIIYMKDGKVTKEEVIRDKRPEETKQGDGETVEEKVSQEEIGIPSELRILMRTFRNLSPQQVGVLLVPFKVKQLMSHVLSSLTDEQLTSAENFLRELLFNNINIDIFRKNLDLDFKQGGANWNKKRADHFTDQVQAIMWQVQNLKANPEGGIITFSEYLTMRFRLTLNPEEILRFQSFLKLRIENKIDRFSLASKLDVPWKSGGLGLNKLSAEKVSQEVEIVMLLKYS